MTARQHPDDGQIARSKPDYSQKTARGRPVAVLSSEFVSITFDELQKRSGAKENIGHDVATHMSE